MNRITTIVTTLALTLTAAACKDKSGNAGTDKPAATKTAEAPKAPALKINEADWVEKDLSTVSPMIHVTMRVPKDAKLEKNGNGGVDIRVAAHYLITVSAMAVSNPAEAVKNQKALTIESSSYMNGKVITEEPTGLVYSMQMKTEENGTTYQPEAHFVHVVEKDGAVYSIHDERPLDAFDTPGSAWSEDLAKQVYAIVKTAKAT